MTFAELLESIAQDIRNGFISVIQDVSDNAILKQLIDAIEAGDYELVWRLLGIMPGSFRPLTRAIEDAFERSAQWVAESYPKILNTPDGKGVFRFDVRNPRAEQWLRNESSNLVAGITEDARVSVRSALETGMRAGRGPRNTALDIIGRYDRQAGHRVGGVIGLTPTQQYWVSSTRRQLETLDPRYLTRKLRDKRFDSVVLAAIEDGKPLTKEYVDKLVIRYADITLKHRGDTIARTESVGAFAAADYESTKQVVEMGAAREKDVEREWDTASDMRVRHTHSKMEGQKVGLNEPFISPSGARLMHPHDRSLGAPSEEIIDCRCRVKTVIDWIGAAIND